MACNHPVHRNLCVAAAITLMFVPEGMALANDVGMAAAVVNDVRLRNQGAAQPHPAKVREHIALAEQVSTGAASRLQILLLDRSTFTVGANARLVIDRFVYDPDQKSNFTATVAKGAFRFMSGGKGHGSTSSIKTPVASIGIRGTIVDGVIGAEAIAIARHEAGAGQMSKADPETATLIVLRGPGANTSGMAAAGAIAVEAGGATVEATRPLQAIFVPYPGAQPIGPFMLSLPGLRQLDILILPSANPVLTGGATPNFVPNRPRNPYYPGYRGPIGNPQNSGPSVPNTIPGPGLFGGLPQAGANNPAGQGTPPANGPAPGNGPGNTQQPATGGQPANPQATPTTAGPSAAPPATDNSPNNPPPGSGNKP
jgi:hypothetical protein